MPRGPTVRRADLARALKALAEAGQSVARIEVRPGGGIDIIPGRPDLTPSPASDQPEDLDSWRAKKRGGRAP